MKNNPNTIWKAFLSLSFLIISLFHTNAQQSCPLDSPDFYTVEEDTDGNCYLVFRWPAGEMPELACESPGSPAAGSSDFKGRLIDMQLNDFIIYESGNNCKGNIYDLQYHSTIPDAYITTSSYCDLADLSDLVFKINRTGGSNHQCSLFNNTPLPVDLTHFAALVKNEKIALAWVTASEINNRHFIVERSADGQFFESIEVISGSTNSTREHQYSFTDESPYIGDNYYRLKQVDVDGSYEYSEVVAAHFTVQGKLSFYPTVIADEGTLYYEASESGDLQVQLVDFSGRILRSESLMVKKGSNRFGMKFSELPDGIYYLTVSKSGIHQQKVNTVRMIKSRN